MFNVCDSIVLNTIQNMNCSVNCSHRYAGKVFQVGYYLRYIESAKIGIGKYFQTSKEKKSNGFDDDNDSYMFI